MNNAKTITACEKYLNLAIGDIKVANNSAYHSPLIDLLMRVRKIITKINGSDKKTSSKPQYNITYTVSPEHAKLFEQYERIKKQKSKPVTYILDSDEEEETKKSSSGGRAHDRRNKPQ